MLYLYEYFLLQSIYITPAGENLIYKTGKNKAGKCTFPTVFRSKTTTYIGWQDGDMILDLGIASRDGILSILYKQKLGYII